MIAAAARSADRTLFALGADPQRIKWGIEVSRQARAEAGLDADGIRYGAYVNVVAHPDVAIARKLVIGSLSTFARFSVMHGTVSGPTTERLTELASVGLTKIIVIGPSAGSDREHARAAEREIVDAVLPALGG